jgi:hypothetical protein
MYLNDSHAMPFEKLYSRLGALFRAMGAAL